MTRTPMMSETLAETLQPLPVPRQRRRLAALTAGAVALSVVLAQATPVRADDNDDLLAALAALAVIGVIASAADDDRNEAAQPLPLPPPPAYHPRPSHSYPVHGITLPAACAIEIETRDHREVVLYSDNCLDRLGIHRLPDRCAREVTYQGRRDWLYGQACLREAGYRFQPMPRRDYERPD